MKQNQTLPGTITISSPSDGTVRIEIRDERSRSKFISIRMTHEDLMRGLMGLAERPISMDIVNTDRIGKKAHTETIEVKLGKDVGYGEEREKKAKEYVLAATLKKIEETGKPWIASLYFNSRGSFFYVNEELYAKTSITYYE